MIQAPRLREFLGPSAKFVFVPPGLPPPRRARGLAGWGLIGKAHLEARRRGLTYLALEDGFLRSAGLTGPGGRRLSLVADPDGVDARDQARVEFVRNGVLHQQAAGRGATLAVQRVDHEDYRIERTVQIDVKNRFVTFR
jgi:hypothetical protein